MIRNYIKIAFRNLSKNKVYSFINILGLSIGLSACIVIYLLVSFEFSFENFRDNKNQIYRVVSAFKTPDGKDYYNSGVSAPIPKAIKQEISGIEKLAAFHVYSAKVEIKEKGNVKKFLAAEWGKTKDDIIICEPSFFEIFKYKWLIGSVQNSLNAPNQVVITETKAAKYFGEIPLEDIIGKTIYYNDSLIAKVSGIVQDYPKNTDIIFKDFISFKTIENKTWAKEFSMDEWTNTNGSSQAFLLLPQNASEANINAKLSTFLGKHVDLKNNWNAGRRLFLQPLSDIHFSEQIQDDFSRIVSKPNLKILIGIALFLLVIAAINFVNLATAQSINRVKEIGLRKVLGSNRRNLIYQFLCETFLITFCAVLLSAILIEPIIWAFSNYLPGDLTFNIFSKEIIAFLISITIITTILSGIYPAFVISAFNPIASLKKQIALGGGRTPLFRKALITFQFTASQVFILGTIIVAIQSNYMRTKDMGFNKDAIINFTTPWRSDISKVNVLQNKLKQIPEVQLVSHGNTPVRKGYSTTQLIYNDGKKEIKTDVHRKSIDENYIPMFGLKLLAGRNLAKSDTSKEFVINETYSKLLGFQNPEQAIGKMIDYYATNGSPMKFPIVGVIADFHFQSMHQKINPLFFNAEAASGNLNVKIATTNQNSQTLKGVLNKINKAYNEVYPNTDSKFVPIFFDETIASLYEKETKMAQLLNVTTGIAIIISCMGLFGLVAFSTNQRTKEIGIRKVLGASIKSIVGLISADFLKLISLSIIIASPIAYYFMQQWLQDFSYKIEISWWIFVLAGITAILIALFTISYLAIKAAIANPVESLKVE